MSGGGDGQATHEVRLLALHSPWTTAQKTITGALTLQTACRVERALAHAVRPIERRCATIDRRVLS